MIKSSHKYFQKMNSLHYKWDFTAKWEQTVMSLTVSLKNNFWEATIQFEMSEKRRAGQQITTYPKQKDGNIVMFLFVNYWATPRTCI